MSEPILRVDGLRKAYTRGLLRPTETFRLEADFTVEGPAVVGVMGPNGSGKTTLFELITGSNAPTAGRVLCQGRDIHAVWAGVAENAELRQLAGRCEAAARRAGLAPDRRNYRPHVTLAYLSRPEPAAVAAWIQTHNLLKSPPFSVANFGLYSSRKGSSGPAYHLERDYPLLNRRRLCAI